MDLRIIAIVGFTTSNNTQTIPIPLLNSLPNNLRDHGRSALKALYITAKNIFLMENIM